MGIRKRSQWRHLLVLALSVCLAPGVAVAREFLEADHPQTITAEELLAVLVEGSGPVVVDVRGTGSYERDHLPGALSVPSKTISESTEFLEKYRERGVVLYCGNGRRSSAFSRRLTEAGFRKVYVLEGSLRNWRFSGYPLESGEREPSGSE